MTGVKQSFHLLLFLALLLANSGCAPESAAPATVAPDRSPQQDPTPTEISTFDEADSLQPPVEDVAATEPITVYFDQYHGDDGIGVLGFSDADTAEYLLGTDEEGNQEWGWQTGNGEILPSSDHNQIADFYMRFDLQNHILYQNNQGLIIEISIRYIDTGYDGFSIEYHASSGAGDDVGFIKQTETIMKTNSGELTSAIFLLTDAFFGNGIDDIADFQIYDMDDGAEIIQRVTIRIVDEDETYIAEDSEGEETNTVENPVEGWAVLAEKDDFTDVDMSNMLVDYVDLELLQEVLANAGWKSDHIHEIREFTGESLKQELNWLEEVADENDVVFVFVTGHSGFLKKVVLWDEFFAEEWSQIASHRRLLIVDACLAARFSQAVVGDSNPQLSIGTADEYELLWKALPDEGLSFVGAVFNHYFTEAFTLPEVDTDLDGWISVQEAALWAEARQREFLHYEVFAVPEYLEGFHSLGITPENDPSFPHVIIHDTIGEPLYLDLEAYDQ